MTKAKAPMDPKKRIARLFKEAASNPNKLELSNIATVTSRKTTHVISRILAIRDLSWVAGDRCLAAARRGDLSEAQAQFDESYRLRLWASSEAGDPNTHAATLAEAVLRGQGVRRISQDVAADLAQAVPAELFRFVRWVLGVLDWKGEPGDGLADNPFGAEPGDPNLVLDKMCAWHLKEGTSQKDYAPFLFGAFPLLPVEAKLWNARRAAAGLPEAISEHPLLHTPVAKLTLRPVDPLPEGHPLLTIGAQAILAEGLVTREWVEEVREEFLLSR